MNPAHLPPAVVDALRRGRTVEAIRLLRESGKFGLAEAKSMIEWHARQNKIPIRGRMQEEARPAEPANRPAVTSAPKPHPTRATVVRGLSPGEVPRVGSGGGGAIAVLLVVAALVTIYLLR